MKRILITAGAALLVAVPAATGLIGNTSFAQSVPVRVPSHATLVDDMGGQRTTRITEPGDDKGGHRTTSTTEPGDDKGGQRTTSTTSSDRGAVGDDDAGGKNDGRGGNTNRTGGTDDGSGHT